MQDRTYRSFNLKYHKPGSRSYIRIYDHAGKFKQVSNNAKDAERLIDFCIKHNLWECADAESS